MATKTFKIGEYCKGGVITVETKAKTVTVIGKDWDVSKGTMKSSDQSNAKEFTRLTFNIDKSGVENDLDMFLGELTTSYHSGEIIKWIKSKVKLATSLHW